LTKYEAMQIIEKWIDARQIEVLNVAGSRASEDAGIYEDVKDVLRGLFYPPPEAIARRYPHDIKEAVHVLMDRMPMTEKAVIARMDKHEFGSLQSILGKRIEAEFGLLSGNEGLMQSSRYALKKYEVHEDEIFALIIRELWKRLKETHALRIVK